MWVLKDNVRDLGYKKKTFDVSHSLVGNEFADHSDVVGASPLGAAPTIY